MSRPSHARRVVMVADQPLDPVDEGGVVAGEPIGVVGGEPCSIGSRCQDGGCGLGSVGHSVDEPDRRPEVVVDEGLGGDVSPVRCQPGSSCRVWVTAALSWMLLLRSSLSLP
jgi:hypothetical protein